MSFDEESNSIKAVIDLAKNEFEDSVPAAEEVGYIIYKIKMSSSGGLEEAIKYWYGKGTEMPELWAMDIKEIYKKNDNHLRDMIVAMTGNDKTEGEVYVDKAMSIHLYDSKMEGKSYILFDEGKDSHKEMNEGFDKDSKKIEKEGEESESEFKCRKGEDLDDGEKEECMKMMPKDKDGKSGKDKFSKDRMKSKNMVFFEDIEYNMESKGVIWSGVIDMAKQKEDKPEGDKPEGEKPEGEKPVNSRRL
jgi:hypothetical protein